MSKGFAKTANVVRKNNTETDGISRINSFKQQRGRIQGSDSLSNSEDIPPEQLPEPSPRKPPLRRGPPVRDAPAPAAVRWTAR